MRIKKGDNIIVIGGKDRGKQGKVIKVLPKEGRVTIENINLKKKHQRPKTSGKKGEKIEAPRPVSVSSVMLICKNCGKPVRIGYKILNDLPALPTGQAGGKAGKKIRVCKKCGLEL